MDIKSEERALRIAMLDRWKSSGKSVRVFCEDEKLSYHMFVYWKRKHSKPGIRKGFIKINPKKMGMAKDATCEIIFTNGNRIHLSAPPTPSYLKELLT